VASEGSDPEGESMEYVFEVDAVSSFDGEDFATATIAASGTGEVEWELDDDDIELPQNTLVYARVWAVDAAGISSVPHTISFEVRGENDAPPVPELLSPADGATAESVTPVLEAGLVEDPEGDLVFYDFVVARDMALTDIVAGGEGLGLLAGTGPSGSEGATSWQVDSNLNGQLYWSARSVDEFGEASEWAVAFALLVEGGEPVVTLAEDVLGGGSLAGCDCSSSVAGGPLPLRGLALLSLLLAPLAVRRRRR
jgi:MYXO-CTERM domain-containing protein